MRQGRQNNNNNNQIVIRRPVRESDLKQLENAMFGRIPRMWGGSTPFPSHMIRRLSYTAYGVLAASAQFIVADVCINSADPTDVSGTAAVKYTGFNQLAGIYNIFKVTHVLIELTVTNNEPSLPLFVGYVIRDLAPTTSYTTKPLCQGAFEIAPCSPVATLGLTQGVAGHVFPNRKISLGDVVGNRLAFLSDDSYQAGTTSSTLAPSNQLWLGMIGFTPSASNLTNGFFYKLRITGTFHFWSQSDVVPV